jgi:SNF2 family DNA or RNA helicase
MTTLKLHNYQEKAIEFGMTHDAVYHAIDLGLGKTAIALKTYERLNEPMLVFAPLRVAYHTWPREVEKWCPNLHYEICHGKNREDAVYYEPDILIVNYDTIPWLYKYLSSKSLGWLKRNWQRRAIIFDEATKIKAGKTKRHDYLKRLILINQERRMALSGGPAPNGLTDLFWQYWFLDGGESLGKSEDAFKDKYFFHDINAHKYYPMKGAEIEIYERIAPITFRLEADDWLEMPELIFNPIYVELDDSLMEQYKELENEFFLELLDGAKIEAFNAAAIGMKLRQFVQGAVYDENSNPHFIHDSKYQVLEEIYDGLPTLCAIQFRFERAFIQKFFGHQPVVMGGVSSVMADRYFDNWNAGKLPMMFVHPASVAHGLNLQEGGHVLTFIGLPWDLEHFNQLIGRLHRQGQVNNVIVNMIIAKDTIDEVVYETLKRKDATQQDLLDALKAYAEGSEICSTVCA